MSQILWFIAGLVTLWAVQRFYNWHKTVGLTWYAWLFSAVAYVSFWLLVASVVSLGRQVADWGMRPVYIVGLIFLIITVVFAALARWAVGRHTKAPKAESTTAA